MARKQVQLQRFTSLGQWLTIKRVFLDSNSRVRFEAALPIGTSRLRIAMSVNQAGAGYLAGFSREIVYRRAPCSVCRPGARHSCSPTSTLLPNLDSGRARGRRRPPLRRGDRPRRPSLARWRGHSLEVVRECSEGVRLTH